MKPAPFTYEAPGTVDEALALLSDAEGATEILAGGQSLGPMMNLRLARPDVLIDINRIAELANIEVGAEGQLLLGATVRQRQVETSALVANGWPLISEAVSHIGHRAIRNRGTIGGSVSHADPAAELPAALSALDARFRLASTQGERLLSASEFFVGPFTTARKDHEMLLQIEVPPNPANTEQTWIEYARRDGDFAIVGVAAVLTSDPSGSVSDLRLVFSGADWRPWEPAGVRSMLVGVHPTPEVLDEAGRIAAEESEPPSDIHASTEYRRSLISVLTSRALATCVAARELPRGER